MYGLPEAAVYLKVVSQKACVGIKICLYSLLSKHKHITV